MGPGENRYKYRWADDAEPVGAMTVYGTTLRGRWRKARLLMLKPAARRIRDRLWPPESADAANLQADDAAKQR
jgi:CelD/BcsL family acetyltransferase involved in cellulose biosynthesis